MTSFCLIHILFFVSGIICVVTLYDSSIWRRLSMTPHITEQQQQPRSCTEESVNYSTPNSRTINYSRRGMICELNKFPIKLPREISGKWTAERRAQHQQTGGLTLRLIAPTLLSLKRECMRKWEELAPCTSHIFLHLLVVMKCSFFSGNERSQHHRSCNQH